MTSSFVQGVSIDFIAEYLMVFLFLVAFKCRCCEMEWILRYKIFERVMHKLVPIIPKIME